MAKVGRPPKYKKKYIKKMLDFFRIPVYEESIIKITNKKGEIIEKKERFPNEYPTKEKFADIIGVNCDTLVEWSKVKNKSGKLKYPEFSAAYKKIGELQRNFIIQAGLLGFYHPLYCQFVATNTTDMKNQQNVDMKTKGTVVIKKISYDDAE